MPSDLPASPQKPQSLLLLAGEGVNLVSPKIYSYVVARDFGFAPNPFYKFCTLATCKPKIREKASEGDWVVGTGAQKNNCQGYLVFAMKIEEILHFNSYWEDKRFACKKPLLNGTVKKLYGDNIYHQDGEKWIQENSHHSFKDGSPNIENVNNDTCLTTNVLVSSNFVYFGNKKNYHLDDISSMLNIKESLCKEGQGYKCKFTQETIEIFTRWIENNPLQGLQGLPYEFSRAERINND